MVSMKISLQKHEKLLKYHFEAGSLASLADVDNKRFLFTSKPFSFLGSHWRFKLKTSSSHPDWLSMYLICTKDDVLAQYECTIEHFVAEEHTLNGKKKSEKEIVVFGPKSQGWKVAGLKVAEIYELEPHEYRQLTFTIKLVVYGPQEVNEVSPPNPVVLNVGQSIRQNVVSDFIVELSDESEIPTHRTILAAASPVFRSMLAHDLMENLDNRIKIEDFGHEVVRQFIDVLYKGELSDIDAKVYDLKQMFAIADKYKVDSLAKTCLAHLVNNLNKSNACFIFGSMKRCGYHQGTEYENRAARYINENLDALDGTDDFKALSRDPTILLSILRQRGKKRKRDEIE